MITIIYILKVYFDFLLFFVRTLSVRNDFSSFVFPALGCNEPHYYPNHFYFNIRYTESDSIEDLTKVVLSRMKNASSFKNFRQTGMLYMV